MSQTPNPNDPRPAQRPNPSVESTRRDDEMARQAHEDASGVGTVVGAGLGCLGFTLAPWVMALVAILAGVVVIAVVRSCGPSAGGTSGTSATGRSDATPAAVQLERAATHG
jgi:hypothetical protein